MPSDDPKNPSDIQTREAMLSDLPAIVAMLADDPLGVTRERSGTELDPAYVAAFQEIAKSKAAMILVAIHGSSVVGCLQLNFIANLSLTGTRRGQIEGVRTAKGWRGMGVGRLLISKAVDICRQQRCGLLQLTTNRTRQDAIDFYQRCGFVPSHVGFKMKL